MIFTNTVDGQIVGGQGGGAEIYLACVQTQIQMQIQVQTKTQIQMQMQI